MTAGSLFCRDGLVEGLIRDQAFSPGIKDGQAHVSTGFFVLYAESDAIRCNAAEAIAESNTQPDMKYSRALYCSVTLFSQTSFL